MVLILTFCILAILSLLFFYVCHLCEHRQQGLWCVFPHSCNGGQCLVVTTRYIPTLCFKKSISLGGDVFTYLLHSYCPPTVYQAQNQALGYTAELNLSPVPQGTVQQGFMELESNDKCDVSKQKYRVLWEHLIGRIQSEGREVTDKLCFKMF